MREGCVWREASKDKSCRKDVFSGWASKDKSCGNDVFSGGASKDESCRKDMFAGGGGLQGQVMRE